MLQSEAEKKQKEAELAQELKRIKIKNQFLEADKEAVERKKSESQQAGEQREIIERQRIKLEESSPPRRALGVAPTAYDY